MLIRGFLLAPNLKPYGIPVSYIKDDLVVNIEDMNTIYSNVNANEKFYYHSFGAHSGPVNLISLSDNFITKSIIRDLVNGKDKTNYEHLLLNTTG